MVIFLYDLYILGWPFMVIFLYNLYIFGVHLWTVLYPKPCCNEPCYKEVVVYEKNIYIFRMKKKAHQYILQYPVVLDADSEGPDQTAETGLLLSSIMQSVTCLTADSGIASLSPSLAW